MVKNYKPRSQISDVRRCDCIMLLGELLSIVPSFVLYHVETWNLAIFSLRKLMVNARTPIYSG